MKPKTINKIQPIRQTKIYNENAPHQKKSIQPMHKKLYESSLFESNFVNKSVVPSSHPSYIKDDGSKPKDMYTLYGNTKSVVIGFVPMKKIQVMPAHKKLYESVVQKSEFINKAQVPSSHISYDKKDYSYSVPKTTSFNKKIDFYKTTFDFLKP